MEVGKNADSVYVLDISGHAATLYVYSDEESVITRTTGKANN
jgi:hypothetical protein